MLYDMNDAYGVKNKSDACYVLTSQLNQSEMDENSDGETFDNLEEVMDEGVLKRFSTAQ